MLKKLKKAIPAVISAILCVTVAFGTAASAADNSSDIWKDAKTLANAKYNSKYIKWVEKYSEKESKSTVVYAKSRTKKFLDKLLAKTESEDPKFSFSLIDNDGLVSYTFKDGSLKVVSLIDGENVAVFINDNSISLISVKNKTKVTANGEGSSDERLVQIAKEYTGKMSEEIADTFDFEISENEKGKIFKFKSDEKIYYYEEFECDGYFNYVGFVFTEKGTPVAVIIDRASFCVNFKTQVDDSDFDIPKGYKDIDLDDFEF